MTDAEIGVIGFEDGGGAAAKEYRQPLEAEKGKEVGSPLSSSKRNQPC